MILGGNAGGKVYWRNKFCDKPSPALLYPALTLRCILYTLELLLPALAA